MADDDLNLTGESFVNSAVDPVLGLFVDPALDPCVDLVLGLFVDPRCALA